MKLSLPPLAAIGLTALAGVNLLLMVMAVVQFWQRDENAIGAVEWTPKLSLMTSSAQEARAIDDTGEILARPVFFKSRAPYVPPPPAPPPPPVANSTPPPIINPDPGLLLAGVMITDRVRKAYLVKKADSQGTWASEGENLMGWKVHSVSAKSVTLQLQDRTVKLLLYPQR